MTKPKVFGTLTRKRTISMIIGLLVVLVVVIGWLLGDGEGGSDAKNAQVSGQTRSSASSRAGPVGDGIAESELPPTARRTLQLIDRGGPFPYRQDGATFSNRERLLPQQPRGYYREYTVPKPGARDRGPWRIVTGGDGPEKFYWTADHYGSFREIYR